MKPLALRLPIAAALLAACFVGTTASAAGTVTINTNPIPETSIPGLSAFMTTGADMTGLSVRAIFSNGLDETLAWATTVPGSAGAVTGSGWSLSLTGDSFNSPWLFDIDNSQNLGQLSALVLDGENGFTVLDRTASGASSTPGSENGTDFAFALNTCNSCDSFATYSARTAIGAALPVGDLWQTLTISFINPLNGNNNGPRTDWAFLQDTDNDIRGRPLIPEPETYAMLLAGLGLMGFIVRRRKRNATA